eukprot:gene10892-3596_t
MSYKEYKVAVIGGGGVGKSCLTVQYVQNTFLEEYDPTIEDSYSKQTNVEGKTYLLQILDTAGQEEYSALRDTYMRSSDGFVLVFDLTKKRTMTDVDTFIKKISQVKDVDSFPIVLVGNKSDLVSEREITANSIKDTLDRHSNKGTWNIPYFECSAKTRTNVDEAFIGIIKTLRDFDPNGTVKPEPKKKGGCVLL